MRFGKRTPSACLRYPVPKPDPFRLARQAVTRGARCSVAARGDDNGVQRLFSCAGLRAHQRDRGGLSLPACAGGERTPSSFTRIRVVANSGGPHERAESGRTQLRRQRQTKTDSVEAHIGGKTRPGRGTTNSRRVAPATTPKHALRTRDRPRGIAHSAAG